MSKHRKRVTRRQVIMWLTFIIIALIVILTVTIFLIVRASGNDVPTATTTRTEAAPATTVSTTAAQTTPMHSVNTTTTTSEPLGNNHYRQPENAPWNLKLANDWNTLPDNYDTTFTAVEYGEGLSGKLFDSRAVDALRRMLAAGNATDPSLRLQPVSCYRSIALQRSLYERQVQRHLAQGYAQERAEQIAATIVKRPGQSEHNTGLAVDCGGSGNYRLEQDFENTAAFRWLRDHCAEYGFILRFPKDKEAITGVIYEPWHYRYVGEEAAREIMDKGLCLEEYLEMYGK